MDFGLAFTYPTKDPNWLQKLLVVALINLIPIIGQIYVIGWMIEIIRRAVIQRQPISLPDVDFGNFLTKGFKAFIVSFVFAIPMIIVSIPMGIFSSLMDSSDAQTAWAIVSMCMGLIMFLYGLLLAFIVPAAYAILAVKDSVADALRPSDIFHLLKSAPGAYVVAILGTIVSGLLAPLGVIACGIGVLFTGVYASAVNAHFYAQAYLEATHSVQPGLPTEFVQ